jgi:uncharacterized membrane protein YesL
MPRKNNKNTLFSRLTGYDKDGKGVKKRKITDKERYSLKSFFMVYRTQFWNLITLNLIFMLLISPALCGLLWFTEVFHTRVPTPSNILFAPLYGAQLCAPTAAGTNIMGIYGAQSTIPLNNGVTLALSYGMLVVFLTFGPANAGLTHVLRSYTRGDFALMRHDFFRTIKKNFLSSIAMGACDLLMMILLGFSTVYYYSTDGPSNTVLFLIMFGMSFIYLLMRFYIYILLITFKLPPLKLIKNAFILAILGIKRNIMGFLGIAAFVGLCVGLLFVSVPFGITVPLFFLVSNCSFAACFAAYANVKKYMIDPYYDHKDGEKYDITIEEEPIFEDRG